jgi:hypothetical protein
MSRRYQAWARRLVLTTDGELRKTRLFRSHEQAELVGAILRTRGRCFRRKGWA